MSVILNTKHSSFRSLGRTALLAAGLIVAVTAGAKTLQEPTAQVSSQTAPSRLAEYPVRGITSFRPDHQMTLWYTKPVTAEQVADPWMDYALPIGNGQLGGMVYGGIHQDVVQFNEKTLWQGSSTSRGAYYDFGYLYMEDLSGLSTSGVHDYCRQLDMEDATARASWTSDEGAVSYRKDYLVSYPDQVMAICVKASDKGRVSQKFYLYNINGESPFYTADGYGVFGGKLMTVSYNACIKVVPVGGTMTADSTGISVRDADEVLVILRAATDYDPVAPSYVSHTAGLASNVRTIVDRAAAKGWDRLLKDHIADYQHFYNRVALDLNAADNVVPTTTLVDTYSTTTDPRQQRLLEQLYFQYGRYLLIASSRGVDLPNNLQGIWNNRRDDSFWQCDMHADVNVQMNYWAAEKTNLSELHEKYLNYLYNMAVVQPQWQGYARDRAGQTTGWVNYTENNIFGHCTTWANDHYLEAGAWACSHLWQHYRYTLDKAFLQKKALPVMISCVNFWMERMVRNPKDGTWECPAEWSPEHGPVDNATAHSQQIVSNLFSNTIEAINIVGTEAAGITPDRFQAIKEKFAHIDRGLHKEAYPGKHSRFGVNPGDSILREWKTCSYMLNDESHRHLSHLMALYPLNTISTTSDYFKPAVRSLMLRGLQSQGWSMGWKMNLWARALQGDSCRDIFRLAFRHAKAYDIDMSPNAGGIYYNLLDAHSPFQIDGNFGVCAGMAEMLLQNDCDTLSVLPALPAVWSQGSVSGLRAERGFEAAITWKAGHATTFTIRSLAGQPLFIRLGRDAVRYKVIDSHGKRLKPFFRHAGVLGYATSPGSVLTFTAKD